MSRLSVEEIQSRIAARVDQDETTGNITSSDYSLRLKYINMAQQEWAETYEWDVLYAESNTLTSQATGNLSIALPADFRKIATPPLITWDGINTYQFMPILPLQDAQYGQTDKRTWILGNPGDAYTLRVFGVSMLASGASIKIGYWKSVGSLASPADLSLIPNAAYLVQRVVSQIWEAREDPRYPQAKAEAELILQNMLEFEETKGFAYNDRIKSVDETRYGFRLGEN